MPRTARLSVRGGFFHLISRFARDERHLDKKGGRDVYLALVASAAARTDAKILAYCLMSNHVHLVIEQGEEPLSRFMKSVHTGFARWTHAQTKRTKSQGPVFAERARGILVEKSRLLELVRYVHNNPVRAGVVKRARDSSWSSHRAYVGIVEAPAWLETQLVLAKFGRDRRGAAKALEAFVDEKRDEPRRPELSGLADAREAAQVRRELGTGHRLSDGILGTSTFVDAVRKARSRTEAKLSARELRSGASARPPVRAVIDTVLSLLDVDAIELKNRPKSRRAANVKRLAIWVWTHEYAGSQIELARALSLDTSVMSRYYGQAIENAGEFDEIASAVVARLRRLKTKKGAIKAYSPMPVRYHVDVDEV